MPEEESDLRLLAGAYFHQDFRLDSSDEEEVVRLFSRKEGPESAEHAAAEIAALLERQATDQGLAQLWTADYGAEFNPTRAGMTYRQWFERMLEILRHG